MNTIAAIDDQLRIEAGVIEDQRALVERARASAGFAQRKIDALLVARQSMVDVAKLYDVEVVEPPAIPEFDEKPKSMVIMNSGGPGIGPPRKPRQPARTDDDLVDAVRELGGRAIAAEVAVKLTMEESGVRNRLARLVEAGRLTKEPGESRGSVGGRAAAVFVVPAPASGAPNDDDTGEGAGFVRSPTERMLAEPLRVSESSEDALDQAEAQINDHPSPDIGLGDPNEVPEPRWEHSAEVGDGMGPPPPTLNGSKPAAAKPKAPPISRRTQRALSLPPKPPAASVLDGRLWTIFHDAAPNAEWKINELQGQLGRRFPGAVPDRGSIEDALNRLRVSMKVVVDGNHWSRAVEPA